MTLAGGKQGQDADLSEREAGVRLAFAFVRDVGAAVDGVRDVLGLLARGCEDTRQRYGFGAGGQP